MTQADSVHSTPPTNTSATRRNILGTIAVGGATALTLPAHAAAPAVDPIYAAIEKHRAAAAAQIQRIHGFGRGDWITEKLVMTRTMHSGLSSEHWRARAWACLPSCSTFKT
jgi:hypothetical protein